MSTISLHEKIDKLPEIFRKMLEPYVDYLLTKAREESRKKVRRAGTLEGKIWMSDDFNEPLEDFKDYM